MTLRLTINEQAWRAHVDAQFAATPGLVPVVKGNGYGFGRRTLARNAMAFADEIAVGTVHELADVVDLARARPNVTVVALTPAVHLAADIPSGSVPTVGSIVHVDALRQHGFTGRVAVKLESSMHRHGASVDQLSDVLDAARSAGFDIHQFVLHLPMPSPSFTAADARTQIDAWLPHLDAAVPMSLSHLSGDVYQQVRDAHADRSFRLRAGTSLWHGDKSSLHLQADVLEVRSITAGEPFGYRQARAIASGTLVMVGAGSAHGVAALDGGLSPFHHARRRLPLAEPPHMHTTMLMVADDGPVPSIGDWLDVQRPLIMVTVDELAWQ